MFANFVVIVILVLTHRPGREPKLHENPLLVYIPTGDIFILAQGVNHILGEGGNFAWHTGATRAGFSKLQNAENGSSDFGLWDYLIDLTKND
jgi:hypothetical protein